MSDYVCETCSKDARFVFVSLDAVVSASCEEHRQPVGRRLAELAFQPAPSGVMWADLAELRVEDYSVGMRVSTYGGYRAVPRGTASERELTPEEHISLLRTEHEGARSHQRARRRERAAARGAGQGER
jgi:hypothetical protein